MKESETSPPRRSRGVGLAILFGLVWFALLAGVWYLTEKTGENGSESNLMIFLGRFHALVVHLPIGLIFLVPLFEILGRKKAWKGLRESVPAVLWLVFLGALASSFFGYLLMQGEMIESRLMTLHLWTGLGVGVAALFTLVFKQLAWGPLYAICLIASLGLIGSAGHFGGALVHGKEYLAAYAPEILKPALMFGLAEKSEDTGESLAGAGEPASAETEEIAFEDRNVYADFIAPVLEAKCNECHNEEKTKGKLRTDTHELLLAGVEGADYPNVAPGNSDDSEMIYRVTLDPDDDDFMPPDGKEPLNPEELKLLRWWIDTGASAEMTVAEADADDDMLEILLAIEASLQGGDDAAALASGPVGEWDLLGPEERMERLDAAKDLARQYNFSLMPISAEDDRLRINVVNAAKNFSDEQLAELEPVAERVVWLDLARSQVTDAGLESVAKMRNLERLHLENTRITDAGIAEIDRLSKLQYLNLYGTPVTAAIFESLDGMRDLRKLYLWQTKVDPAAAKAFQKSMSLEVNTGYELAASNSESASSESEEKKSTEEKEEPAAEKPDPKSKKQPAASDPDRNRRRKSQRNRRVRE